MAKLFEGARREKKYVIKSVIFALVFWAIQFAYQFYVFEPGNIQSAIIRSSAFTSATLLGLALLTGPLSRIFPSKNYVFHRRTLGVLGLTCSMLHYISVMAYVFSFNLLAAVSITDPFINPVIFGLIAFWLYVPLYLTSTDWATQKLGQRAWKTIHRLVYFAWILNVIHFTTINTAALETPPGYLLLVVTSLVFMFELAAFAKHVGKNKNKLGATIGIIIILFGASLFYQAYAIRKIDYLIWIAEAAVIGAIILLVATKLKKKPAAQTTAPQPVQ